MEKVALHGKMSSGLQHVKIRGCSVDLHSTVKHCEPNYIRTRERRERKNAEKTEWRCCLINLWSVRLKRYFLCASFVLVEKKIHRKRKVSFEIYHALSEGILVRASSPLGGKDRYYTAASWIRFELFRSDLVW